MSSPSTTDVSDEIVAAAGEFIRSYEAVVTIYELLDELGDRFPGFVTPDMRKLVIKMTTSLLTRYAGLGAQLCRAGRFVDLLLGRPRRTDDPVPHQNPAPAPADR